MEEKIVPSNSCIWPCHKSDLGSTSHQSTRKL